MGPAHPSGDFDGQKASKVEDVWEKHTLYGRAARALIHWSHGVQERKMRNLRLPYCAYAMAQAASCLVYSEMGMK